MNIEKMREAAERPAVRKWKWFTSNSHVRLSDLDSGKDGDVIHAFAAKGGYPCVSVNQYVMQFIEEFSPSAAIELLDNLRDAEKRIAKLEGNARFDLRSRGWAIARAIKAEEELAQRDVETPMISVAQQLPEPNDQVLLYDQNGEGWVIGWRSVWRTFGQKETGKWEWSFQITELNSENTNITHWAPIPDKPEMETL